MHHRTLVLVGHRLLLALLVGVVVVVVVVVVGLFVVVVVVVVVVVYLGLVVVLVYYHPRDQKRTYGGDGEFPRQVLLQWKVVVDCLSMLLLLLLRCSIIKVVGFNNLSHQYILTIVEPRCLNTTM